MNGGDIFIATGVARCAGTTSLNQLTISSDVKKTERLLVIIQCRHFGCRHREIATKQHKSGYRSSGSPKEQEWSGLQLEPVYLLVLVLNASRATTCLSLHRGPRFPDSQNNKGAAEQLPTYVWIRLKTVHKLLSRVSPGDLRSVCNRSSSTFVAGPRSAFLPNRFRDLFSGSVIPTEGRIACRNENRQLRKAFGSQTTLFASHNFELLLYHSSQRLDPTSPKAGSQFRALIKIPSTGAAIKHNKPPTTTKEPEGQRGVCSNHRNRRK
ncbi:hypothetical protein B0F90DRAFT_1669995 [Multifurca ochricompacta]|uniref:Uncharacterized protein n=1 Tax=Multifurca ochricompacta TaxID=376703 RepID=A0AAD4QL64_9AGAM|nr:hypothetical protein B0F90DRAFT_1669995 [Multifurca ochricompacta]